MLAQRRTHALVARQPPARSQRVKVTRSLDSAALLRAQEKFLAEVRHLAQRMVLVEGDHVGQRGNRPARHQLAQPVGRARLELGEQHLDLAGRNLLRRFDRHRVDQFGAMGCSTAPSSA